MRIPRSAHLRYALGVMLFEEQRLEEAEEMLRGAAAGKNARKPFVL
jgi:hypothetical protein